MTRQLQQRGASKRVSYNVPDVLWPALRSDHAGETGAAYIYRGVLRVSRNAEVRAFALKHMATERMKEIFPPPRRSRLLGVWRLAGRLTGALSAVSGASAVFRAIEAVETFVDNHYVAQTRVLASDQRCAALYMLLEQCRLDEVAHRDDAGHRNGVPGPIGRFWYAIVDRGSRIGFAAASRS